MMGGDIFSKTTRLAQSHSRLTTAKRNIRFKENTIQMLSTKDEQKTFNDDINDCLLDEDPPMVEDDQI